MVKAFQSDILASIADYSEESVDKEDVSKVSDGDDLADGGENFDVDEESDFDFKELRHDIAFAQYLVSGLLVCS